MLAPVLLATVLASIPAQEGPSGVRALPWKVLGPFRASAAPSTAQRTDLEAALSTLEQGQPWSALDDAYVGIDELPLRWRNLPAGAASNGMVALHGAAEATAFDVGVIDLRGALPPMLTEGDRGQKVAGYLYRTLLVSEATRLEVLCGSDDGLALWLNGRLLARHDGRRQLDPYAHRVQLKLEPGVNHLMVKAVVRDGPWRFSIRATGGSPTDAAIVNAAVARGVEYLVARQLADGSWPDYREAHPDGMTALVCYTLMKSGLSPDHPTVRRGLAYLRRLDPTGTYSVGLALMALAAAHDPADLPWMKDLTDELIDTQLGNGMWGYPSGGGDLSNTQYAALGLRAAVAAGIEVPEDIWRDLARGVSGCTSGGGFGYSLGGHGASASMTAAGVGTLAICREQLAGGRGSKRIDGDIEDGIDWLARNCPLHDEKLRPGTWSYYMVYGLERAGALAGVEQFGDHAWYPEGAAVLLGQQHRNGGWFSGLNSGANDISSCFALLFLRRATSRPVTTSGDADEDSPDGRFLASSPTEGALWLRLSLQAPANMWIDARSPAFDHLAKVVYWVLPPDGTWQRVEKTDGRRYAVRLEFDAAGLWQLRASGFLEDGTTVDSGTLEVEVGSAESTPDVARDASLDQLLRRLAELQRNPMRVTRTRASSHSGSHHTARLLDARMKSGWRCAADDDAPWAEIELRATRRITRVRLTPSPMDADELLPRPQAARVRIAFSDGTQRIVAVPEDPAGILDLTIDPPVRSDSVRIEILDVRHGALGAASVGFGELLLD